SLTAEMPLNFQSWCDLQAKHNKTVDVATLLPFQETPSDLSYWSVHEQSLTYGGTQAESFCLDEDTTKLALTDSHRAFGSEPIDLFLAAIAQAFAKIFS